MKKNEIVARLEARACSAGMDWLRRQPEGADISAIVEAAIADGGEAMRYARWGVARLMTPEQAAAWARWCAVRARNLYSRVESADYAAMDAHIVWGIETAADWAAEAAAETALDAAQPANDDAWDAGWAAETAEQLREAVRLIEEGNK